MSASFRHRKIHYKIRITKHLKPKHFKLCFNWISQHPNGNINQSCLPSISEGTIMKVERKKWHKYSVHLCNDKELKARHVFNHSQVTNFGGNTQKKGKTPRLFQIVSIDILSKKSVKIVTDREATSLPCV